MNETPRCPFKVGDLVRFKPSARTQGLYQDVEAFGLKIGEVSQIAFIKDDTYLYFDGERGGWPWNEFEAI
jgi:hypothetical protein